MLLRAASGNIKTAELLWPQLIDISGTIWRSVHSCGQAFGGIS